MDAPAQPPDLGVVIVSYDTWPLLDACLRSLGAALDADGLHAEVWVVDNGSPDGSAALAGAHHPWARVVAAGRNLGFTAANNVVLRRWASGAAACPPWVLVLNPDTEVPPGALAALVAALAADPRAAVAGPALAYPDGRFQHAAFRFPGLAQTALDLWPVGRWMDGVVNGRYPRAAYDAGRPFAVDAVLGACMLVRGAALRAVGPLDEGFFLYCEELDWCRRFRAAGWRCLCVPAARVVHHGGASTGQVRAWSFAALWRARRRYFALHGGAWTRRAVDGLLRLALAERSWRERRAVRAGRLAAEAAAARAAAYRAILSGDPRAPTAEALAELAR